MSHEFYYTSAPKGLVKGSRGYCAVAMTKGLPPFLAERLEDYSGYKPLFGALDPRNPVNVAYYRLDLGAKTYYILTRVAAAGLDYTERTNKFAHHVVLAADELPEAGPAWLARQPGFLETAWDGGEPRWLPAGRKAPAGSANAKICKAWSAATGDAGWAGVLAECALAAPMRPAVVLYEPGTDVLALFAESMALLPEKLRWRVTFSTYASSLPPGESCVWRGLALGSPEAAGGPHLHGAEVIRLSPSMPPAVGGALVAAARSGKSARAATADADEPSSAEWNRRPPREAGRDESSSGDWNRRPARESNRDEPSSGDWNRKPARDAAESTALDDPNLAMGQISLDSLQATEDEAVQEKPRATPRPSIIAPAKGGPPTWRMPAALVGFGVAAALALLLLGELVSGKSVADLVKSDAPGAKADELVAEKEQRIQELQSEITTLQQQLKVATSGSGEQKGNLIDALQSQAEARRAEIRKLEEAKKALQADLDEKSDQVRRAQNRAADLKRQLDEAEADRDAKKEIIAKLQKLAKKNAEPPPDPGEVHRLELRLYPVSESKKFGKQEVNMLTGVSGKFDVSLMLVARSKQLHWITTDSGTKLQLRYTDGAAAHTFLELTVEFPATAGGPPILVSKFQEASKNYKASPALREAVEGLEKEATLFVRSHNERGSVRAFRFHIKKPDDWPGK